MLRAPVMCINTSCWAETLFCIVYHTNLIHIFTLTQNVLPDIVYIRALSSFWARYHLFHYCLKASFFLGEIYWEIFLNKYSIGNLSLIEMSVSVRKYVINPQWITSFHCPKWSAHLIRNGCWVTCLDPVRSETKANKSPACWDLNCQSKWAPVEQPNKAIRPLKSMVFLGLPLKSTISRLDVLGGRSELIWLWSVLDDLWFNVK